MHILDWLKLKTLTISSVGKHMEQREFSYIDGGNGTTSLESSLAASYLHLLHDSASLSVFTREIKSYVHTKTCTWMFIAALFAIVPN